MKDIDKKRMVFAFYLNEKTFENPINNLHIEFLEKYINRFDEVIFGIIIDDGLDNFYIKQFQKKILSFCHKNVTFHIYPNTLYREAIVFYNEIAQKLDILDGITFYAHNKHTSDMTKEELIIWVCGLYYFNFEVQYAYDETGLCFFGTPLLTNVDFNIKAVRNKYKWYFAGNFYWVKCQEVNRFIKNNNLELPKLTNRYYSEMFPGELSDFWGFARTPFCTFINGNDIDIKNVYMNLYYGENQWLYDDFCKLYEEKIKKIRDENNR